MSKWKEKLTAKLELPGELTEGVPKLSLTGDSQILAENYGTLLAFSGESIELGSGRLGLRIRGEGLTLRSMSGEELLICGQIFSVEAERR